jgi:hypothetical protein
LGASILQPSATNLGQIVEGSLQLKTSLTEHWSGYSDSRIQGIMNYIDFTIRARDWQDRQFKVEVTSSPVDRMREPAVSTYDEAALARPLYNLERKRIHLKDLIALGEALADMLLPPAVRQMLLRSLSAVGPEQGLRLRLVLDDPQAANLPWEYLHLYRTGGDPPAPVGAAPWPAWRSQDGQVQAGRDGFLVLDPRISLVRHEAIPMAPASVTATRPLKVVVGLAAPSDAPPLDLEAERDFIQAALKDVAGIDVNFVTKLTVEKLEAACQGAHLFHFAGHGHFGGEQGAEREGAIVLEDTEGYSYPFPAENLALTLRGAGVRVVVLGACESGRRDGVNAWSGVAPALMRTGIPGAVAMQYETYDDSAAAFARRFYQSLAAGLSLDEAVGAGRLAVLNLGGRDDVDWGVPMLYMRSPDGVIFPEVTADAALDQIRVEVRQQVKELYGKLLGAEVGKMTNGAFEVAQEINTVAEGGEAVGFKADELGGGNVKTDQKVDRIDRGGSVTGAKIDKL